MKKIIVGIVIAVLLLGGLSFCYIANRSNLKFKNEFERLNNKTYTQDAKETKYITVKIDANNPVIYLNNQNIIKNIKNGNKIIMFGNKKDNGTRNVVETLLEVAKENNVDKVYYYNVEKDSKMNDKIVETINNNNIKKIEAPLVIVVNKGKIVSYHMGTVGTHNDYSKELTKEEKQELSKSYENLILDLIMCTDDC